MTSVEPLMKDKAEKEKKIDSGGRLGFGDGFVYFLAIKAFPVSKTDT